MSLSLLLEKYDVSTDEGLQKALNEIEKEELEVDEALSGVLSRACTLEGKLRTTSQAYLKLSEVKADTEYAADMVNKTADLARDVSAKVRQLDLARSRVAECQRRVHDLIDLQLCSAGVEAAIKAHDYETGAAHVSRFLSMDPGSVAAARARGAPDPRAGMARAAHTLREHLVRKFEEAARKDDEASVERLFKLFPQIGQAEEGVDLLAKYFAIKADVEITRASVCNEGGRAAGGEAAVYADAMTRVLERGASAVERVRKLVTPLAPGLLPRALKVLQPKICAGARRVCTELVNSRRRGAAAGGPGGGGAIGSGIGGAVGSALNAEPALAELALAHSRTRLYVAFLRRHAQADASGLDEVAKQKCLEEVEKIISESDLTRTSQDLLGHYLELERFFLEESVNKALKLATPQAGTTASTLVDDVFFIARKVIRRAISSGSVDGACAVLNEVASALERQAAAALRKWLRSPPPDPLPLSPPPSSGSAAASALELAADLASRLNRDVDAQRQLYLAHMSAAESGAEWAERLASEAVAAAAPLLRSQADSEKLSSCAGGLAPAAAGFQAAAELARSALLAALKPRLTAWADALADPGYYPEEMEEDADALPQALDQFVESGRAHISGRTMDALLVTMLTEIAARAEARMLHYHYDRAGGLGVERRARRLASWAGGAAGGARERCARLAQAGALVALERLEHARDALSPSARLSAADARALLATRADFKIEEIKRLKL